MKKEKPDFISKERKTYGLQSAAKSILPLAKAMLGKNGFVEIDLIRNWDEIAGEEMADYSFPQRLEFRRGQKNNGVLHVAVPGGAFALELQHREKTIINRINNYFGYPAVNSLKIIQSQELPIKETVEVQRPQKSLVTEEEENYIKSLSEEVENPALKDVLERLGRQIVSNSKGEK